MRVDLDVLERDSGLHYARVRTKCAVCQHPVSGVVSAPMADPTVAVARALADHWQAVHLQGPTSDRIS